MAENPEAQQDLVRQFYAQVEAAAEACGSFLNMARDPFKAPEQVVSAGFDVQNAIYHLHVTNAAALGKVHRV